MVAAPAAHLGDADGAGLARVGEAVGDVDAAAGEAGEPLGQVPPAHDVVEDGVHPPACRARPHLPAGPRRPRWGSAMLAEDASKDDAVLRIDTAARTCASHAGAPP